MPAPDLEQKCKAEALGALHHAADPVLLVNVWDIASARVIEQAGFPALATTSAGIAFVEGYPDGEQIPPERMLSCVAQIAESVRVPVTADVEAGYGHTPEQAFHTTQNVISGGAVGMNFEDATGNPERPLADLSLQVERIRAIRAAAAKSDVALVLNARTDVYLLQIGEPGKRYDETVRRLSAFRDAGADCVFAPGVRDAETIGRLVKDLKCPLNILAVPGGPSAAELSALGVKRISLGSGPMRAAIGLLRRLAEEVKAKGTWSAMDGAPSHAEMNDLMKANREPGHGN
ncbi:MAG TPA: isocitrate lyase/phosphoenolpyruvate mutase family protein [Candidatus Sulfotelmatobacter sp.]|nr:isocitrate lyase/phosphoenolpyruvate mutase family protein [Candidatus Sulfotelmatobacter sp.]